MISEILHIYNASSPAWPYLDCLRITPIASSGSSITWILFDSLIFILFFCCSSFISSTLWDWFFPLEVCSLSIFCFKLMKEFQLKWKMSETCCGLNWTQWDALIPELNRSQLRNEFLTKAYQLIHIISYFSSSVNYWFDNRCCFFFFFDFFILFSIQRFLVLSTGLNGIIAPPADWKIDDSLKMGGKFARVSDEFFLYLFLCCSATWWYDLRTTTNNHMVYLVNNLTTTLNIG